VLLPEVLVELFPIGRRIPKRRKEASLAVILRISLVQQIIPQFLRSNDRAVCMR